MGLYKKLFKFNSMFFLKHIYDIFFSFFQLQWNPIAPSKRSKICSSICLKNSSIKFKQLLKI